MPLKFCDVFENINRKAFGEFHDAVVLKIVVNKDRTKMKIYIECKKVINEIQLQEIENAIKENDKTLEYVYIDVVYTLNDSKKDKIFLYWNNLIHNIAKTSQLEAVILKKSNFIFDDDKLQIKIDRNSKYVLEKNNFKQRVTNMLKEKINEDIEIDFIIEERRKEISVSDEFVIEKTVATPKIYAREEDIVLDEKPVIKEEPKFRKRRTSARDNITVDENFEEEAVQIKGNIEQDTSIVIAGEIIGVETREIRSGKYLVSVDMTDNTDSITIKFFIEPEYYKEEFKPILESKGRRFIKVKGVIRYDMYSNELNIMANIIKKLDGEEFITKRVDECEEKRVELHLHTSMSSMDAVNHVSDYIMMAKKLGHKAIAITDHGVVQAFPDAMDFSKKEGIKILYGVEAYLVNDTETIVFSLEEDKSFVDTEFVIFDIETTGFYNRTCKIIEIGAVKIKNGEIIDEYMSFVNPNESLSEEIVRLTKIDDKMLINERPINAVLNEFLEFCGDAVLVAHNVQFDISFINKNAKEINGKGIDNAYIDTVGLTRMLHQDFKNYKLNTVAEKYRVSLNDHHRAIYDAKCLAEIFIKQIDELKLDGFETLSELNKLGTDRTNKKQIKSNHTIIFAKTQSGLKNLYELISASHLDYFYRTPKIPKSELIKKREGLIIGSACEDGEVFKAHFNNLPEKHIDKIVEFYDYLEVQPVGNNMYLLKQNQVSSVEELCEINYDIIKRAKKHEKLFVATGDVHFLNKEDEIYRRILMDSKGFKDADDQPPLFYRTTEEMLDEFSYIDEELRKDAVITNPNIIADMIEEILPIPKETSAPNMPTADEEIVDITYKKARKIYGDNLPEPVEKRLKRELDSIIKNGFAGLYIIAQKLVWNSLENGYLVGSRGSVGSSLAATFLDVTEVNPLSPHYVCPECKYSEFDSEVCKEFAGMSGADMPDKDCPECGAKLNKDGHDIPFETFLGFDGDKEPDIDLNFSSEYQAKAHAYTEELFGKGKIFKAGTIGTLADKTAYTYVCKYLEKREIDVRNAEKNRLKSGIIGTKKTTGQHPGGLMVVPDYTDIHYFTPVQRPADDVKSTVTTTHFDYHSISGRLLKLDILGHTAPTIIKFLEETTKVDPLKIDIGDKKIMSLFTSKEELGLKADDISCPTGSLGLPEFGTDFVRQMLVETKPNSFSELARISGLSHGTDVWIGNAQELVKNGTCTLKEVIPTRDDIMVYLINKGVDNLKSFTIMESVRKGKGLSQEQEQLLVDNNVPNWYIESCKKISYMFPKGHAVAYVIMSVRIAYFKIYYPKDFYAATFSISADDFDYEIMCVSRGKVKAEMARIQSLDKSTITASDKSKFGLLELLDEMYAREINFLPLDLYESQATRFVIKDSGILPPLCSVAGLGISVAEAIVREREIEKFDTIEDLKNRTKVNKNVIEILKSHNVLSGMSETNQMSLLDW